MSSLKVINNDLEDINMGSSRGRSNKYNINSSGESSIDSKFSDDKYAHKIEIQNSDLNWANQVNAEIFHILLSSQAKEESNN